MIAADTNIPVRLIVADDDRQVAAILALLESERVYLPLTVLLETEWVLRSRYNYARKRIAAAFRGLMALPNLEVEDRDGVAWAIDRYARRGDFADFIHMVASRPMTAFATFDVDVEKNAGTGAPISVRTLTA